ncbi:MAG: Flp family type IVb pilin [Candidatus Desantisbacteria bacterium]
MERQNKHEHGQGMVEYGLIIGLIAVIVIAIFVALGPQIKTIFMGKSATSVEQATNGTETTTEMATQTAIGTATAQ